MMFDNYNNSKTINNLKIQACSGGIYKSFRESWFVRFHLNSVLMEKLSDFSKVKYSKCNNKYYNHWRDYSEDAKSVVVLQMVICGEMEVIAEIIYEEDLDKYFDEQQRHMIKQDEMVEVKEDE